MFPYLNIWKFCERFLYKKSTTFISQVAQLSPILCDPIHCSMPSFPVHHQLPKFAQIHVHRFDDAIQPSHSLLPPSLPALNLSQHQSLFQWVCSLHQVASILKLQRQPFQWIFSTDFSVYWSFSVNPSNEYSVLISQNWDQDGLIWSPFSPRDSKESSPTSQFKSINSLVLSFLYSSNLTSIHEYWKSHSFDYMDIWQ